MIYKYNLACGFRHLGKLVRRPFRSFPTNFIFLKGLWRRLTKRQNLVYEWSSRPNSCQSQHEFAPDNVRCLAVLFIPEITLVIFFMPNLYYVTKIDIVYNYASQWNLTFLTLLLHILQYFWCKWTIISFWDRWIKCI
jgi:hypothetical protein